MKTAAGMTNAEIAAALERGELDEYLGTTNRELRRARAEQEASAAQGADQGARELHHGSPLDGKTSAEIAAALERGELDEYLRTPNRELPGPFRRR
jgi:IS30 family transposase